MRSAPRTTSVLTAAFLIAFIAGRTSAQNIGATLQGLVTDEQHAVLPGVTVSITNVDTGITRTVVTDATGWYRAAALPPGSYQMAAELVGFVVYKRAGLTYTSGQ